MARIFERPPRWDDVAMLVANLRPTDRDELHASNGPHVDLHNVVRHALHISHHRWAVEINGELAALGGVADVSILNGVGSLWMLGSVVLSHYPRVLMRIGKRYRDTALGHYEHLVNYVDARNTGSIKWLKKLGFDVHLEPTPYGPQNMPFHKFELRRN